MTIGALTACLLGTAVGATTLPPAAGARPAAAPASDPPAPAPLDCAHWRYDNVQPGPLPKEQDPSDYKRTSERTKTAALHDSPQQLCGQMGPATDLAWGITQGSDAVTTALLDSGIKWRDAGPMNDLGTPGLGDWDGDGTAEMAVVRRDGQLLVWHTKAASSSLTEWSRYGHDGSNDANYATATH